MLVTTNIDPDQAPIKYPLIVLADGQRWATVRLQPTDTGGRIMTFYDVVERIEKALGIAFTIVKIYAMFWLGTLLWCGVRISYDILREWHFWFA